MRFISSLLSEEIGPPTITYTNPHFEVVVNGTIYILVTTCVTTSQLLGNGKTQTMVVMLSKHHMMSIKDNGGESPVDCFFTGMTGTETHRRSTD